MWPSTARDSTLANSPIHGAATMVEFPHEVLQGVNVSGVGRRHPAMQSRDLRERYRMSKRILASMLLFAAMACSGGNSTPSTPASPTPPSSPTSAPSVSSVTISGTAPIVGATVPFSATAHLSNGTSQTITNEATWSSSNTVVATVTNGGLVTGVGLGVADISATYQGVAGTAQVPVVRATYTVSGLVMDSTSNAVLPNVTVQVVDSAGTAKSTQTDNGGSYTISGVLAGPVMLTASALSYQSTAKTVTVSSDTRVDIVLSRTPPNYAGTWTGRYDITECQDVDGPGLTPLMLCSMLQRQITYRFTLSQNGNGVTGLYSLTSPLFSCPCGGDYGTFDMSGVIAPAGALAISASGSPRATGLAAAMTFNVAVTPASALAGTVSGGFTVGGILRATFSGQLLSGTR